MALIAALVIFTVLGIGFAVYLALSSCLGDNIRARHTGRGHSRGDSESRQRFTTTYDEHYLNNMPFTSPESIEMDDFARPRERHVSEESDLRNYD